MATYIELYDLATDPDLLKKISMAVAIKAEIMSHDPALTQQQKDWVRDSLTSPMSFAKKLMFPLLAQNKSQDVATIQGASEAIIQTLVDNAVDDIFGR